MVDFSERDEVKRWLDAIKPAERRREVAVVIAARAALRVAPLTYKPVRQSKKRRDAAFSAIVLPVFRATALPWVAAVNAPHGNELRLAANAANAAANAADAYAAASAAADADAADAAYAAANAAAAAAAAAANAADADAAAYAAAFAAAANAAAAAANAADAAWIDAGRPAAQLARAPLWLEGAPGWADRAWQDLRSAMLASHEDWRVWTDWYEARLLGNLTWPVNEALEVARALIDDDTWKQGPRAVNAEIGRIIAEHESLKARPAAFRFQVVADKIDAAPLDARPLDAETAREFYDEAKLKAGKLSKTLERAQADENLRVHLARLIQRLGASYAGMQPGLMISTLRSLESDVRAYDSEEGRKELSAAQLSQIIDVTASVRDLCSTFPILREIEVEAVSLDLPKQRLPEIRDTIGSVVDTVNHSDGVTENGREAINASAENIANQRGPEEEVRQSAYFLVDFAEFARSGLRHLKKVGGVVGGELGGLGADSWKAFRRGAPKGVERGAAQLGRAVIVGGVGGLMHALGSDIAAIAGMVAAYDPLNTVLQHMTNSPPAPHVPHPAPPEAPAASSDADLTKTARLPRAPKKRAPQKRGKA
jgi:hypothetical protein